MALRLLGAGLAAFMLISAASANRYEDCETSKDPVRIIAGCTEIIDGDDESTEDRVDAYLQRAWAHRERGEKDLAIEDATTAILLEPGFSQPYLTRGAIHLLWNNLAEALSDAGRGLALDPKNPNLILLRADALNALGERERAEGDYTDVIALDPTIADAYVGRGDTFAFRRSPDLERALDDYDKALKLDSKNYGAHEGRARLHLRQKKYALAIADLTEMIALDATAYAHFIRATAYENEGASEKAIDDYTQAIRLDPEMRSAYLGRSAVLRE